MFKELFQDKVKLRVSFSLDNLKLDDLLNIPLFMVDEAEQLTPKEKRSALGRC